MTGSIIIQALHTQNQSYIVFHPIIQQPIKVLGMGPVQHRKFQFTMLESVAHFTALVTDMVYKELYLLSAQHMPIHDQVPHNNQTTCSNSNKIREK